MKVFASQFLETMSTNDELVAAAWTWTPNKEDVREIYASGRSTSTRESTYGSEKDNRSDSDRPNEGLLIA